MYVGDRYIRYDDTFTGMEAGGQGLGFFDKLQTGQIIRLTGVVAQDRPEGGVLTPTFRLFKRGNLTLQHLVWNGTGFNISGFMNILITSAEQLSFQWTHLNANDTFTVNVFGEWIEQ